MSFVIPQVEELKDKAHGAYGYIYKTTNLVNGKIYIGQHIGDFDRSYLGSGTKIALAIKKYGRNNFSVVQISRSDSPELLDQAEIENIAQHRALFGEAMLYNIERGGYHQGCPRGKRSEDTLRIISTALKDKYARGEMVNPKGMLGKHHTKEVCARISRALEKRITKPMSEVTRQRLSIMFSGANNPRFGKKHTKNTLAKMRSTWKIKRASGYRYIGHPLSDEAKNKISAARKGQPSPMLGRHHSEETKYKMGLSQKKRLALCS